MYVCGFCPLVELTGVVLNLVLWGDPINFVSICCSPILLIHFFRKYLFTLLPGMHQPIYKHSESQFGNESWFSMIINKYAYFLCNAIALNNVQCL